MRIFTFMLLRFFCSFSLFLRFFCAFLLFSTKSASLCRDQFLLGVSLAIVNLDSTSRSNLSECSSSVRPVLQFLPTFLFTGRAYDNKKPFLASAVGKRVKFKLDPSGILGLVVGLQHRHGLLHLALQGGGGLEHVQQLRVVDLQQHPGDLAGQVGVLALEGKD